MGQMIKKVGKSVKKDFSIVLFLFLEDFNKLKSVIITIGYKKELSCSTMGQNLKKTSQNSKKYLFFLQKITFFSK
jgi:hypothetical protein